MGSELCGNYDRCGALASITAHDLLCDGCCRRWYCSATCKRDAWVAGHWVQCKEIQRQRGAAADAVMALSGTVTPFAPTLAAALTGDAGAMFDVGAAYEAGAGVAQSSASAVEWYTRCAEYPARARWVWAALGRCYEDGRGVAADAAEAVRLYRIGVAADSDNARFQLAHCLEAGVGVPGIDTPAACALYKAAAAQDHVGAMLRLGACYANGRGVARDVPRAMALFTRVLAHPDADPDAVSAAACKLGVTYWNGDDGVPANAALAARYLRQAAAAGNEIAGRMLRDIGGMSRRYPHSTGTRATLTPRSRRATLNRAATARDDSTLASL